MHVGDVDLKPLTELVDCGEGFGRIPRLRVQVASQSETDEHSRWIGFCLSHLNEFTGQRRLAVRLRRCRKLITECFVDGLFSSSLFRIRRDCQHLATTTIRQRLFIQNNLLIKLLNGCRSTTRGPCHDRCDQPKIVFMSAGFSLGKGDAALLVSQSRKSGTQERDRLLSRTSL